MTGGDLLQTLRWTAFKRIVQAGIRGGLRVGFGVLLVGCAVASGRYAYYGIEYAANARTPNAEILDWQFGDHAYVDQNHQLLPRAPKSYVERGIPVNPQGMSGMLPVGDFLYVKWREKASGLVHEERANLSGKLPYDMTNYGIVWLVDGPQLRIFLFPPSQFRDVTGHLSPTVGLAAMPSRGQMFMDMPWNLQHQIYP